MILGLYLNHFQIGDYGGQLRAGDLLPISIAASLPSPLAPDIPVFEWYFDSVGTKGISRVGMFEHVVSGKVVDVRKRAGSPGVILVEALVDCGIPIAVGVIGIPSPDGIDLVSRRSRAIRRGDYVSAIVWLHGRIAYAESSVFNERVQSRIYSMSTIDLSPSGNPGQLRSEVLLESSSVRMPVLLEVEIPVSVDSDNSNPAGSPGN